MGPIRRPPALVLACAHLEDRACVIRDSDVRENRSQQDSQQDKGKAWIRDRRGCLDPITRRKD